MKRLSDQTLYEILEIPTGATPEEIERAYERLHGLYAPGSLVTYTLVPPDEAALLNNRIEEARVVLLDPSARQRYDERLGISARPQEALEPEPPGVTPAAPVPAPAAAPDATGLPGAVAESPAVSPWPLLAEAVAVTPAPPPAPPPAGGPAVGGERPVSPGLPVPVEPTVAEAAREAPPPAPLQLTVPVPGPAGAPIPLTREVAPPELPPPDANHWTGELLRQVREARGVSLQQLAERTRVTRHHLENIEAERWKALPAPVYLRGILMALARELRLDGQRVARSYLGRAGGGELIEPPGRR